MLLLLLLLLLSLILVVSSITSNSTVISALAVVNSDSYLLEKGDSIDEFVIFERLDYLGLPSLYWFDPNEHIEYDKLDDSDDSKTMVTIMGSKMLPFLPLLPEPSLLSTSSSASKGYITILKQLRSNDEMNNTTCQLNGTFCIDQLIFHGGHGDVYRANRIDYDGNIEFNTSYILKRMYIKDRPAIERCALREIYFGELLKGQARIARYERYFQDNDNYWLVFLDEGVSLQSLLYVISVNNGLAVMEPSQFWIRLRKYDANMLRSIMKQIILGVSQLHDIGIVHRDCKPSNVLIRTENSKPKLVIADFSSAVSDIALMNNLYGEAGPRIDEETLSYAPPEVLLSLSPGREIPYDKANPESYDTWSIGVVFLELILGTADVFSLDQRTTALINQRIKNDDKAKADALLLAALADYCILPQDLKAMKTNLYDVALYADNNDHDHEKTKKRNYPLFKNVDGYYTIQDQPRCGLEELRLAILKRDPLAYGFNHRWGLDLIRKLLMFKPSERISLNKALKHAYFVGPYVSEIDGSEYATEEELDRSYENIESESSSDLAKDITTDITFTCSSCGRRFNDYYACHKHITARGHSKCYYDQSQLPPCLSESIFLPLDPTSGWCDLQGRRAYIEDEHIIYYKDDHKFFGVLDGHFGQDASNYVGRNLYDLFYEEIKICESSELTSSSFNDAIDQMSANLDVNNKIEWRNIINITKNMNDVLMIDESRNRSVNAATAICAIEKAFNQVNTNFIKTSKSNSTSGTTATIAMLFKNHLLISHVGDSRVVLCCNSDGHPIQATLDHTPYSQKEAQRVYDSGGYVEKNGGVLRVNGRLAITRSIGDKNMREVLSSTPDVLLINLEGSNTMKSSIISNNNCVKYANLLGSANLMFMVLASDGLWDVVSNQDATEIVCEFLMNELLSNQEYDNNENYVNYDSLHNAAKLLAHEAYVRQSMDNIGVCVTMILK